MLSGELSNLDCAGNAGLDGMAGYQVRLQQAVKFDQLGHGPQIEH
jgi:hypothetical protein